MEKTRNLRKLLIKTLGAKCKICNSTKKLVLHHKDYEIDNSVNLNDKLEVLCSKCHFKEHKLLRKNFIKSLPDRIIKTVKSRDSNKMKYRIGVIYLPKEWIGKRVEIKEV